jgi:hypothetical protein
MSDSWLMGALAAQDSYNPEEGGFQAGIRDTPWYQEFAAKHGAPNLEDPNYDYRRAWAAGARPTVRDPGDGELHWPSTFKGENHPNRYVGGVDTISGDRQLPDVGPPLVGDGGQLSPGLPVVNRMAEILTTAKADTPRDETVRYRTASPLVNITEGDIGRATEAAMGVSGGGMSTKGIKAYHSSPHDFDKFDLAKIGTGEGAQVYGHGLYFAENPAVSGQGGQYWDQFSHRFMGPEGKAMEFLKAADFDRDKAIASFRKGIDFLTEQYPNNPNIVPRQYREALALLESGQPVGPRTYEVNINADPAHMLDWDKPLREMSSEVQRAAGRVVDRDIPNEPGWGKTTGEQFHTAIGERVGRKPDVATALREAGIPGIKYLDQGSRNAPISSMGVKQLEGRLAQYKADLAGGFGDPERMKYNIASIERELASYKPSYNYVVFDPGIIDIMKKYGIAGAAPVGMGALAAQDRYE